MSIQKPTSCDPTAYWLFAATLPALSTNRGLLRAAIALSMHELPEVDPQTVEAEVMAIAESIGRRVKNPLPDALLAHLHEELFVEYGFRGNADDYYQSANSYVPCVLQTGRGLPISLCLIYTVVARELGLRADGINSPAHFLVQVAGADTPMYVDPFFGGQMLTREDALERIAVFSGRPLGTADEFLRPATHQQWIARMLHNLVSTFANEGRPEDVAAMTDMLQLLSQSIE